MAGKKGAKASAKKTPKTPKPPKAEKSPKAAAPAPIGHNLRVPTKTEMSDFKTRLDKLFEQKASKNAEFMTDIKAVYEEAASKLGVSRKIIRTFYTKGRAEEAFADWQAELESKEADDLDRLMAAGAKMGGPLGAYCIAQGDLRNHKPAEELPPTPSKLIKGADKPKAAETPEPVAMLSEDGKHVLPVPKGRLGHQVGIADGAENDGTLVS